MAHMVKRILQVIIGCLVCVLVLGASTLPPGDKVEQARRFTRAIEFDYVAWTLEALGVKLGQGALGTVRYLPSAEYKEQGRPEPCRKTKFPHVHMAMTGMRNTRTGSLTCTSTRGTPVTP